MAYIFSSTLSTIVTPAGGGSGKLVSLIVGGVGGVGVGGFGVGGFGVGGFGVGVGVGVGGVGGSGFGGSGFFVGVVDLSVGV
jgi:hypothetical protein